MTWGQSYFLPVTPVILTADEAPNLARTLDSLGWAEWVLVVDSGSGDQTEAIARSHANVVFDVRDSRGPEAQWSYAIRHPQVEARWVLALDADMVVPRVFVEEIRERFVPGGFAGGSVRFHYAVGGRRLLGSLYPPDVRVLDRSRSSVRGRGHTHVFEVDGPLYRFRARILHDDRKSLDRFLVSQDRYAQREAERIAAGVDLEFRDRLCRRGWLGPWMFALDYLKAGGPLRGRVALRYAHERACYETLLAPRLLRGDEALGRGVGRRRDRDLGRRGTDPLVPLRR